jgi:hypothetical protein
MDGGRETSQQVDIVDGPTYSNEPQVVLGQTSVLVGRNVTTSRSSLSSVRFETLYSKRVDFLYGMLLHHNTFTYQGNEHFLQSLGTCGSTETAWEHQNRILHSSLHPRQVCGQSGLCGFEDYSGI